MASSTSRLSYDGYQKFRTRLGTYSNNIVSRDQRVFINLGSFIKVAI